MSSPSRQRRPKALVDEAIDFGHGRSDPLVTHTKMLRLELLNVKADLERELEDFSLNCSKCGHQQHVVSVTPVTGRALRDVRERHHLDRGGGPCS